MARGFRSSNPNEAGPSRPRTPSSSSSSEEVEELQLIARRRRPGGIVIGGPRVSDAPPSVPIDVVPLSVAPPADSLVGPSSFPSTMTAGDLAHVRDLYRIPDDVQLTVPGPGDRVTSSGPGKIALYEDFLAGGLRFPFHPFFLSFLSHFRLVPCQLTPNSIRVLSSFLVFCSFLGFVPRFSLFRAFFQLKKCPSDAGWWYLSPRPKLLKFDLPSSIKGWKSRFFFASVAEVDFVWSEPDRTPNRNPRVEPEDEGSFQLLIESEVPTLEKLLTERNLFEAGIGHVQTAPVDPAMKFNLSALNQTSRKRASAASTPESASKKARSEDAPPPAAAAPPAAVAPSSEPGVAGGPSAPGQLKATEPEVICVDSDARKEKGKAPMYEAVPTPKGDSAIAAPAREAPPIQPGPAPGTGSIRRGGSSSSTLPGDVSAIQDRATARRVMGDMSFPRDRRLRKGRPVLETLQGILPLLITVGTDVLLLEDYIRYSGKKEAERDGKLRKLEADVNELLTKGQGLQARVAELEGAQTKARIDADERQRAYCELRALSEKRREDDADTIRRLSHENRRLNTDEHRLKGELERVRKNVTHLTDELDKARARARDAVPKFKESAEFVAEMQEAASDAYLKGVSHCWTTAKGFMAAPGLEGLAEALGFRGEDLAGIARRAAEEEMTTGAEVPAAAEAIPDAPRSEGAPTEPIDGGEAASVPEVADPAGQTGAGVPP